MKSTSHTIKQVAELYDISIDTLRYYEEIGLVVPGRNARNGYREYRSKDFSRLNIISSLLDMKFNLGQISDFLQNHSLARSLELIEVEVDTLSAQIDELTHKRKKVESCLLQLARAMHEAPKERITIKEYPERPYLAIGPMPSNSNDIPLCVAQRAKGLGIAIDAFHGIPCFSLTTSPLSEEGEYTSSQVFLYTTAAPFETDTAFPAGRYASITFSGGAKRTPEMHRRLCEHIAKEGLEPVGEPVEFWHVHEYISDDSSEYIQTLEQLTNDSS